MLYSNHYVENPVIKLIHGTALCLVIAVAGCQTDRQTAEQYEADIIVYGGTASGVIAAVQAARMNKSVILVFII